jgi:hypothetical protein
MWPIQLAFRFLISCRIFLCSLTLSNTSQRDHGRKKYKHKYQMKAYRNLLRMREAAKCLSLGLKTLTIDAET